MYSHTNSAPCEKFKTKHRMKNSISQKNRHQIEVYFRKSFNELRFLYIPTEQKVLKSVRSLFP